MVLIGFTVTLELRYCYHPLSLIPSQTQYKHQSRITQYQNGNIWNRFNIDRHDKLRFG
jgi:hypothetical protein